MCVVTGYGEWNVWLLEIWLISFGSFIVCVITVCVECGKYMRNRGLYLLFRCVRNRVMKPGFGAPPTLTAR